MSLKIKNSPLVQACKDQIQALSQTVYGNPNIFQKKLEDIEKNPILGESLSWQVVANPKLVGNLTGKKVLGIKNKARKEAEENITPLCLALENYADTVKKVRESILHGHRAGQTLRRSSLNLKQMAEDLQMPHKAKQKTGPLSQKEMARKLQSNSMVQYCHAEITYWCTVAYGDPDILQYSLQELHIIPEIADNLAWQITTRPTFFGKLAGLNVYGLKNEARKQAESALPRLGEAIEGYAEAIKHAKETILQSQGEQQKHHTQSLQQEQSMQRQQSLSESLRTAVDASVEGSQAVQPHMVTTSKQQRQQSMPSSSPTQTKRRAPLPPQEQSRQSLSTSPQTTEQSPTHEHQETPQASTQTHWEKLGAKPRTMRDSEQKRQESPSSPSSTQTKCRAPLPPQEQSRQSPSTSPQTAVDASVEGSQSVQPHMVTTSKQQRQQSMPSPSSTQTKRRAPLPPQEQSRQSPSTSPQTAEYAPTRGHQTTVETSVQTEQSPQAVRPRMMKTPQTKKTPPLSHKEMAEKVQSNISVQRALTDVYNCSNIVYGDPFIFKYHTEDIQKIPLLGEGLSWQVANYPKIFAPLSGRKMLGIKNDARKNAEEAIPSLCSAIDHYTETVKKVREDIVKAHEEQQKLQEHSPQQEKSRQKQQSLSESPQTPERSARDRHQEASEKFMQAEQSLQAARSRKTESSKAMTLSG
ncbi:hypothetical protein GCM10023262_12470 [Bartonella pachyuromydis]|uniref:BepF protein n=2 Tax=Bartonella pachyuromydis TaxID=931097 RepID=A0ABP8VIT5_9HYPH